MRFQLEQITAWTVNLSGCSGIGQTYWPATNILWTPKPIWSG